MTKQNSKIKQRKQQHQKECAQTTGHKMVVVDKRIGQERCTVCDKTNGV